ncbi:MAG: hypothetical protein KAH96_03805 [Alphaproteobacteria bacterium]|nr:hypothetical protein [Alphaproteobacteria bacterium]
MKLSIISKVWTKINAMISRVEEEKFGLDSAWYIRYPLAIISIAITVGIASYAIDASNKGATWAVWACAAYFGIFALGYAREITGSLLGLFVLYWIYMGIAALPSTAWICASIIIGAIIIAITVSKK